VLAVVVLGGTFAAGAGPAGADTVTQPFGGFFEYTDDPGDASTLNVTASLGSLVITQSGGDTITEALADCEGTGTSTITCTGPDVENYRLSLEDLDDIATLDGTLGGGADGGPGIDTITGSDGNTDSEFLSGGDGNDIINTRNVGPSAFAFANGDSASGGDGNDLITTGNGDDQANGDGGGIFLAVAGAPAGSETITGAGDGGTGTDVISTGAGDDFGSGDFGDGDRVDLGEGNDIGLVRGGDGTGDVTDGGPGLDVIELVSDCCDPVPPDAYSADLAAGAATKTNAPTESDSIPNFEDVTTDRGADTVLGSDGSNVIDTGEQGGFAIAAATDEDALVTGDGLPGPPDAGDSVNPRGGADQVNTGPGDDSIDSRDGSQDRLSCGSGTDTVQADQFDTHVGCENVAITDTRAAGADTDAPGCRVARVKASYSRSAFTKGFPVRVTCDEAATLLLRIVATLKGGNNLTARAGDLVLAERTVRASANQPKGTRLKPAKKLLRRFRKGKGIRARVVVEARDQYGNRSQNVKRVRVKKAKRKRR
jgi:hypothetical protein